MENRWRIWLLILAFQGLNWFCKVDWALLRYSKAADNVNRLGIKGEKLQFQLKKQLWPFLTNLWNKTWKKYLHFNNLHDTEDKSLPVLVDHHLSLKSCKFQPGYFRVLKWKIMDNAVICTVRFISFVSKPYPHFKSFNGFVVPLEIY